SRAKIRALDTADLTANLRNRLTDWQGLLQRQTPEARQILRRLLVGRLVFTPKQDGIGRYYEFVGQGSISEVGCGAVLPKEWWPQRDSNPCFSLERAVSWASRRWGQPARDVAGGGGLEPPLPGPEPGVLPLDDPPGSPQRRTIRTRAPPLVNARDAH